MSQVIFVGWGRFIDSNGVKRTVLAPPDAPYLWDFLASEAQELARLGFTHIQLPPASKAQGGNGAGCDGYGVQMRRDLGVFNFGGSVETRYGTKEMLQRLIGVSHANGLGVFLDIVLHQLMGENGGPGVFNYPSSTPGVLGRGSTTPGWFRGATGNKDPVPPFCNEDDVPEQPDFAFGREISFQNCNPARVTVEDALDYTAWLFATTNADGARIDDTKGMYSPAILELVKSKPFQGKRVYAEFYDGNVNTLEWYVKTLTDNIIGVEDFPIHWALQNACNNFTAHGLNGVGFSSIAGANLSVGFVDSADTDTSYGQQIVECKLLAYAFLFTIDTTPAVYGKDYYSSKIWPGAYGLKPWIDNMVWVHRKFANGGTTTQYYDDKVLVLNRTGTPGLLTGINFDTYNVRTITCKCSWPVGTWLHDYSGLSPDSDINVQPGNLVTFRIPSNAYATGQSYVFYAPGGLDGPIQISKHTTTQEFWGAEDLDISPAVNGIKDVGRIWCDKNTKVNVVFTPATVSPPIMDDGIVAVMVTSPSSSMVYTTYEYSKAENQAVLNFVTSDVGWYVISTQGENLSAKVPFVIKTTYTAGPFTTEDLDFVV